MSDGTYLQAFELFGFEYLEEEIQVNTFLRPVIFLHVEDGIGRNEGQKYFKTVAPLSGAGIKRGKRGLVVRLYICTPIHWNTFVEEIHA